MDVSTTTKVTRVEQCKANAKKRSEQKRQATISALAQLQREKRTITKAAVTRQAGVSLVFLRSHPGLVQAIEEAARARSALVSSCIGYLAHPFEKNGSLAVANALILISFLLKRGNSHRGRSKEHRFRSCKQQTTTKKIASEAGFLSPCHVLHTQKMFRTKPGED